MSCGWKGLGREVGAVDGTKVELVRVEDVALNARFWVVAGSRRECRRDSDPAVR